MQTPNKSSKKLLTVNHKIKVFHRIFTLVIILEIKMTAVYISPQNTTELIMFLKY